MSLPMWQKLVYLKNMKKSFLLLLALLTGTANAALQNLTVSSKLEASIQKSAERTTGRGCMSDTFTAGFDQDNGRLSAYIPQFVGLTTKNEARYTLISSDWERKLILPGWSYNNAMWNIVLHDLEQDVDVYISLTNLDDTTMTYGSCYLTPTP